MCVLLLMKTPIFNWFRDLIPSCKSRKDRTSREQRKVETVLSANLQPIKQQISMCHLRFHLIGSRRKVVVCHSIIVSSLLDCSKTQICLMENQHPFLSAKHNFKLNSTTRKNSNFAKHKLITRAPIFSK